MEQIAQFINQTIEILKVISWPIIVIIIFFNLKKPITRLIDRIKKAGTKDFGLEFNTEIQPKDTSHGALKAISTEVINLNLEQIISNFNENSIKYVESIIENETSISKIQDPKNKEKVLMDYSKLLVFVLNFNRIYNLIFGSQLEILYHLEITDFQKKSYLKKYYDSAAEEHPDFYKNYNFNQYLHFLEISKLTEPIDDGQVKITDFGRDFLKYVYETGLSTKKIL